uniref:Uncharacterized protein n=1 Tax=Rhodnius prolixus TaxID=13249 RepID=T1IEX7_RHOPR
MSLFIQQVERSETEECSGEKFHSEVVFHDYTATEQLEVTVDEDGNTQPTVIVEERRAPMKKPNILQRHLTSSVRHNNNEVIRKISNEYVLSDKSIRKAEALEQIAYNLGRLATVFEKVSGLIGLINQQHEQQEQHESEEQASEDVGVKVDGLIMNILSDDNF